MTKSVFRILAINPGSTSTKISVFDDEKLIFEKTIRHSKEDFAVFKTSIEQKDLRYSLICQSLSEAGIAISGINAAVGRGGRLRPVQSGVYIVDDTMLGDLYREFSAIHASCLGAIIAHQIGTENNIPSYIVDPIVVDELCPNARFSGIPEIERQCVFHALNTKAIARRHAKKINSSYGKLRLIVAHMGGGITVGAHLYGRVIDVNNALSGEGPFTPERSGSVPLIPLIDICYSGEYTRNELVNKLTVASGMQGYLGTNDMREVESRIMQGDSFAAQVLEAMAYQVGKEIGAMCAVLNGRVDAILLTGGLAFSSRFTGEIRGYVESIAPVYDYPGEDEMLALAEGALRVLKGEETVKLYRP